MNFSYGIIGIVGVLAAISIGFISMDPNHIIEPRLVVGEKVVACTLQWDPMCGVDGVTYGNMCQLNAADVKLDYRGECTIDSEPVMKPCTKDYRPVCGVDGVTYGNMCMLESSGITFDYDGECVIVQPEPEPIPEPELQSNSDDPFDGIKDEDIATYSELFDILPPENDVDAINLGNRIRKWIRDGKPEPRVSNDDQHDDVVDEEKMQKHDKEEFKKKKRRFGFFRR